MQTKGLTKLLALTLFIAAMGCFIKIAWIDIKAYAAQYLIANAWQNTIDFGHAVKPWRWADIWPVARLETADGRSHYILSGMNGQSLAFGPGHLTDSSQPGEPGNMIVAGHRDTHFRFLEHIKSGDIMMLEDKHGKRFHYRVSNTEIVDVQSYALVTHRDYPELVLITCYPFHAFDTGKRMRYIVHALLVQ